MVNFFFFIGHIIFFQGGNYRQARGRSLFFLGNVTFSKHMRGSSRNFIGHFMFQVLATLNVRVSFDVCFVENSLNPRKLFYRLFSAAGKRFPGLLSLIE